MKNYYMALTDEGKATQLTNFATKIGTYATAVGVTSGEVTAATNDAAMFRFILDLQETYKTLKQDVTQYKDILRDGPVGTVLGPIPAPPTPGTPPTAVPAAILYRFKNLVGRIKRHPSYNTAMGEDLGIIGDEQTIDYSSLKPVLNSKLDANRPLIMWIKGPSDGIDIYVDRKDGAGFVFLAFDSVPDYLDTFTIPSGVTTVVWSYKAIYKKGDSQVGQFSEPIDVAVSRKTGY